MDELIDWLRATIEGDLVGALRASSRLPGYSERRGMALNIKHDGVKPEHFSSWPMQGERWAVDSDPLIGGKVLVDGPAARREVAASLDPDTVCATCELEIKA